MIELILGTYGVGCWLIFKKFKLVPITTYTVCTAVLGGIVILLGLAMSIVRKIILRIKSWENYVFFMQNFDALH